MKRLKAFSSPSKADNGASSRLSIGGGLNGALRGFDTPTPRKNGRSTPLSKCRQNSFSKSDRYIPNRGAMDVEMCQHQLLAADHENDGQGQATDQQSFTKNTYKQNLMSVLMENSPSQHCPRRMMSCFDSCNRRPSVNGPLDFASPENGRTLPVKSMRSLPSGPSRILDAPDIVDDYYLNLLSWGSSNVLAVALAGSVYLWNGSTGNIELLVSLEDADDYVTSIAWDSSCNIVIGTSCNTVQFWDCTRLQQKQTFEGHSSRVSSLSWQNEQCFSSGSRDSNILHHDIRASRLCHTFSGHQQEVCGLAWSPDGSTLASGGNENLLCLWDAATSASSPETRHSPRLTLNEHNAAVKALAWCPFQRNVLASGGGTADRNIRFWNCALGHCLKSVDTGSQVCSIQWSDHYKELVSSHGFSDNQLCLWKYPSMSKIREFRGHTSRVLHMAKSPDGSTIVSASADETLRFWDIFGSKAHSSGSRPKKNRAVPSEQWLSSGIHIR